MQYTALKSFLHDQLGRVEKGAIFPATEAQLHAVRRFVEPYETKVVREVPAEPLTYPVELKLRENPPTPEATIAKLKKVKGRK